MEDEITIREYTSEDVEPLYNLLQKTFDISYQSVYPQEGINLFKERYSAEFIQELAAEGYTIVAEYNGMIIGTGNLKDTHLRQVYIDPAYQNLGAGKLIANALEMKARDDQVSFLELGASLSSRKFWELMGYHMDKEEAFPIENNQEMRFFRMSKQL